MATTKKTSPTAKKAVPRKKKVDIDERMKYVDRIFKLRDSVYKKFHGRWSNSYGKDQFEKALKLLSDAATTLNAMY